MINLISIHKPRTRNKSLSKFQQIGKKFKRRSLSRFLKSKNERRKERGREEEEEEGREARWLQFYEVISLKDVETGTG